MKSHPRVLALTAPEGSHVIFAYQMSGTRPLGWLKAYDPERYDGRGDAIFTADITKALRFKDGAAALECWKLVSLTRPYRPDGKPNRPLSAFTAQVAPYAYEPVLDGPAFDILKSIHEAKLASPPKD